MSSRWLASCLVLLNGFAPVLAQNAQLADPMRPALRTPRGGMGSAGSEALRLQGIVIANSRKLALIGGEFLEEGQQIYGLRIERIERESVTVRRDGKTLVLRPESVAVEAETDADAQAGEAR